MAFSPPTIQISISETNRIICVLCKNPVIKGDRCIPYVSTSFHGKTNMREIHFSCFIKTNIDKLGLKEIMTMAGDQNGL